MQEQTRRAEQIEIAKFESVRQGMRTEQRRQIDNLPGFMQPLERAKLAIDEYTIDLLAPERQARSLADSVVGVAPDSAAATEAREIIKSIEQQRDIQKRQEELMIKQLRAMESLDNKSAEGGLLIGND